ncbi:MAG: hypothetical protein KDM91_00235 [Verrucomicrobiae bacterium]|nr:hypothetical protein [Verrucomicrobiae bacterium]MCP5550431.1 hypothetical protein [Akkermansiaceae bacterium]
MFVRRPSFVFRSVLLAGALVAAGLGESGAQQMLLRRNFENAGGTEIEIESVFAGASERGFLPVRVRIVNRSGRKLTWNLAFEFGGNWSNAGYGSRFRVEAPAASETVEELLVPVPSILEASSGYNYRNVSVVVSSPGLATERTNQSFNSTGDWPQIGISAGISVKNGAALDNALKSSSGSRGSSSDHFGAQYDPKSLPGDWRAYTGLDALMMTIEEWRALGTGPRKAIREWVRLGGRLDVYAEGDLGAAFASLGLGEGIEKDGHVSSELGLGGVRTLPWTGGNLIPSTAVTRYKAVENRGLWPAEDYRSGWELYRDFGTKDFNPALVVLLLIVFGIVVGPVNLFVWAKPGRRHRLFVTTPIISLIASFLIMLLILFSDGIGGTGRRVMLGLLQSEPDEKRFYTIQEQVSRTGVLMGGAFEMADPVFLSPAVLPDSEWNRVTGDRSESTRYDLAGRRYSGDWFQSRSEQAHVLRAVRPTRSRIELLAPSPDGKTPPRLFSSLEFAVEDLYYRDDRGAVWKATGEIHEPGTEIALEPTNAAAFSLEKWWRERLKPVSDEIAGRAKTLANRNGHFFAVSRDRRAGLLETLDSIRWRDDVAVICGSVSAAPALEGGAESPEKKP